MIDRLNANCYISVIVTEVYVETLKLIKKLAKWWAFFVPEIYAISSTGKSMGVLYQWL